jgi:hypothetical protein
LRSSQHPADALYNPKKPKQRLANPPVLCIVRCSLAAKSLSGLTSLV